MRKFIFIGFLLLQLISFGQRLNFGFSFNMMSFFYAHFKEDVVFAKHSYRAYYVDRNQFSTGPAVNYNFLTNIDYGRFALGIEAGYYMENEALITKLDYPMAYDTFYSFYSKISYSGYTLSPVFCYILRNRRQFRLFTEAGLPYMFLNESLTREKLASGRSPTSGYWSNQDEMLTEYGLKHDFFSVLFGIGYRTSFISISARYVNKINSKSDPGSNLGYFTFNISSYLNFSKLKKHYIYIE